MFRMFICFSFTVLHFTFSFLVIYEEAWNISGQTWIIFTAKIRIFWKKYRQPLFTECALKVINFSNRNTSVTVGTNVSKIFSEGSSRGLSKVIRRGGGGELAWRNCEFLFNSCFIKTTFKKLFSSFFILNEN